MKRIFAGILLLLFSTVAFRAAEQKYELTEVQSLKIQVKLDEAKLAQQQLNIAQSQFNAAFTAYNATTEAIRKENGWPENVEFDPGTMTYKPVSQPAPAPKVAEPATK